MSTSSITRQIKRGSQPGKCATKVFKHRRKSLWVPTLTGPFPNGQANAGSWLGTKNALYYCAQSANSFSWALFLRPYTTAIITPQLPDSFTKLVRARETFIFYFPNQKRRKWRWVEKCFGCYKQEQLNLHWDNSVSDGSQCIVNNRKCLRCGGDEKVKKCNSLNNFARASRLFVHFFAVTARLPRENA